jgi:type II secretory pathway pseudopilin PulG
MESKAGFNLRRSGVTLVELMVVIVLVVLAGSAVVYAVRLFQDVSMEGSRVSAQTEAQIALSILAKDVKNCAEIVDVSTSPAKLTLKTFNFNKYQFSSPELVAEANLGTVVYEALSRGRLLTLVRTETFPATPARSTEFVRDQLCEEDSDHPLFTPKTGSIVVPYPIPANTELTGVLIQVSACPGGPRDRKHRYIVEASRRNKG